MTRSQGPLLRRHYPASTLVRPCPSPAQPASLTGVGGATSDRKRASPDYPQHLDQRAVPTTPADRDGCMCRLLPHLTRPSPFLRGSASASSLSRPAQASLALRPTGSLNRPRRPLSQGSGPPGCPNRPLASYQINRQLSGWNLPPLVLRAVGAHGEVQARYRQRVMSVQSELCPNLGDGLRAQAAALG
jgi:hypothetical protein